LIACVFPGQGSQKVGIGKALADAFSVCRESFEEADAAEKVAQACLEAAQSEVVSAANLNGAGQVVIAGSRDAVARAGDRAKTMGARRVIPLSVSAPFPCALMQPAADRLAPELRALAVHDPGVPVVANVDAELKRDARSAIEALIAQISSAVQWEGVVRRLASEGVTTYVEVGPGTVLAGLIRKIHRDAKVVSFGGPDDLPAIEALL
jgi:[acyl-carrier-protein] S-malonyltransferase